MFKVHPARRFALALTGLGALLATSAAAAKPIVVKLPASALKDDTSRVCMPRTILGRKADKSLPATMCHTRDECTTQGVTIVTK